MIQGEDGLGALLEGFGNCVGVTLLLCIHRDSPGVTRASGKRNELDHESLLVERKYDRTQSPSLQ